MKKICIIACIFCHILHSMDLINDLHALNKNLHQILDIFNKGLNQYDLTTIEHSKKDIDTIPVIQIKAYSLDELANLVKEIYKDRDKQDYQIMALFNAVYMNAFIQTHDIDYLRTLNTGYGQDAIRHFLGEILGKSKTINDYTTMAIQLFSIQNLNEIFLGMKTYENNIMVLPSAVLFNPKDVDYEKILNQFSMNEKRPALEEVFNNLKSKDNYHYTFVVGLEPLVNLKGTTIRNWYVISIVKRNNKYEIFIVDNTNATHLESDPKGISYVYEYELRNLVAILNNATPIGNLLYEERLHVTRKIRKPHLGSKSIYFLIPGLFNLHLLDTYGVSISKNNNVQITIGDKDIELIQLESLNQFKLAIELKIEPAVCGVMTVLNAFLLNAYINTGSKGWIAYGLKDEKSFGNFLLKIPNSPQWIEFEQMNKTLKNIKDNAKNQKFFLHYLKPYMENIMVISHPTCFDATSHLSDFYCTPELIKQIDRIKENFKNQSEYYYTFIILTADVATMAHWYVASLIKKDNRYQYVIIDSAPAAYHLDQKDPDKTNSNNALRDIGIITNLLK